TVDLGSSVYDTAALGGKVDSLSFDGTATVSYAFFHNTACTGEAFSSENKTVAADGSVPASSTKSSLGAGDYAFQATYNGNDNYNPKTAACEPFSVGKATPTVTTTLSDSLIRVGDTIHDSATLSDAGPNAGGTVEYRYYSSLEACNAGTFDVTGGTNAGDVTVSGGDVPNSDDATFDSAGTFYWRAFYSGDDNNVGASSACVEETLVVISPSITISKLLHSQTIRNGDTPSWTIKVTN